MVNLNHKKRSSKLNESGVSLIALVITIIVVIILAAIAFNSSTSTISKANYSKFVANLSEVQDAVTTKGVTEKGLAAANGNQVTDAQAYNYIAKGGRTEADFLPNSQVSEYTMIAENANIGIELPVIKVNTKNETGVVVSYGVTKDGIVFVWPPYLYEEEYYITATDTVTAENAEGTGAIAIKVGKADITLKTDESGKLEGTTEAGNAGGEDDDTPLTEEERVTLRETLKIGDYVAFPQDTTKVVTVNLAKIYDNINEAEYTITSEAMNWKILDIDEETGKILITTDGVATLTDTATGEETGVVLCGVKGYLNAVSELNRICKELYSTTYSGKTYTARSLTIEDINKLNKYDVESENPNPTRYAYYPIGTDLSKLADNGDITVNGKTYKGTVCRSSLYNGYTEPRFYTWDDPTTGETKMSAGEKDYRVPTESEPVLVTDDFYSYSLKDESKYTIGDGESWLASSCVGAYSDSATFYVRYVDSNGGSKSVTRLAVPDVYASVICNSNGRANYDAPGVRPVVSLSSKLLDLSDESKDGTEEKAWELK